MDQLGYLVVMDRIFSILSLDARLHGTLVCNPT